MQRRVQWLDAKPRWLEECLALTAGPSKGPTPLARSSSVPLTPAAVTPFCTATDGLLQLYAGIHAVSERTRIHDDQRRLLARARACSHPLHEVPRHSSANTRDSSAKARARLGGRGCLVPLPLLQPQQLPQCAGRSSCAAAAQSCKNSKTCWRTGFSPRTTTWPRSSASLRRTISRRRPGSRCWRHSLCRCARRAERHGRCRKRPWQLFNKGTCRRDTDGKCVPAGRAKAAGGAVPIAPSPRERESSCRYKEQSCVCVFAFII